MANKGGRGRIRVFFAEVEGDDETIQEGLQAINVAANKIFQSPPKTIKVLSASAVPSDEDEFVEELFMKSLKLKASRMYGYRCEYCEGTVQPRTVKREAFKHRDGFVILEDVTIGVCDTCGNRYYCADILHGVHAVATGAKLPERTEQIWVTHLESV